MYFIKSNEANLWGKSGDGEEGGKCIEGQNMEM